MKDRRVSLPQRRRHPCPRGGSGWRSAPWANGTGFYTRAVSATSVHLIRHGEVDNPHHVVYADLPGYGLSQLGRAQAAATAAHLAGLTVQRVISSPLLRARQTAIAIARPHGLGVEVDDALGEWALSLRWAGVRWGDLESVLPGELAAYLDNPTDLSFAAESLAECGARVAAVARAAAAAVADGHVVIVGHQDPIHAAQIELTGNTPKNHHSTKPTHGAVITLQPAAGRWCRIGYWEPQQGATFPPVD